MRWWGGAGGDVHTNHRSKRGATPTTRGAHRSTRTAAKTAIAPQIALTEKVPTSSSPCAQLRGALEAGS